MIITNRRTSEKYSINNNRTQKSQAFLPIIQQTKSKESF